MASKAGTVSKTVNGTIYNPIQGVSVTDEQMTNNMPGNVANDIYKATHGGSMSGAATNASSGSYTTKVSTVPSSSSSSSSGSSGSSSSSSSSASYDSGSSGYDYASMISDMLAQQRAAAQEAYNNSRARLEEAWGNTQSSLKSNLDSTLSQLKNQYDYSSGVANDDAAKSLREAYVNYMLNKRNLNQNLSAAGLSGGASESTQANMYNNYGNSRNDINTTLAENIASLLNAYQNNVASANQTYNSQYADAMNNYVSNLNSLESALASNLMSSYSGSSLSNLASYASTLSNLVSDMASTPITETENTLGVDNYTTTSANDTGSSTNYAKYLAMVQQMASSGMSTTQQIQALKNSGASYNDILNIYGA